MDSLNAPAALIAGRYTLDREIGSGGMGTVFLGTDRQTEARVAIKRLDGRRVALQPELAERFQREADALRALNHPNIVRMHEHVVQDGDHYIVMDYVDGPDLSDVLVQQASLPVDRVVDIGIGLADALTRAHYLRIVHRDLKPANILLDGDGTLKLSDFGVAYWEQKARMTRQGITVGTPAYMAPEVINGGTSEPRSDLWSLGVVLFEALAGKHPFYETSLNMLLVNVLINPTPDLQALRPECPDALVDLIERMLEKDAAARVSSARLVGAELEAIANTLTGSAGIRDRPTALAATRFSPESEPAPSIRQNLPGQATPLIGRDAELVELTQTLFDPATRLITIVGPGGMGKTRLALGVANNLLERHRATAPDVFADGIMLVELAPLLSAEPLLPTIANTLGFQFTAEGDPKAQLLDYLREKRMLLIMDNFEHVLDGAPLIADILSAAPSVKVLATSRERLQLQAESVYALTGLDLPGDTADGAALESNNAVKLYLQGARRVHPGWNPSSDDLQQVSRICRAVDGLPLAIMLAAGWMQTLSVAEIADELSRSIDILESDLRDVPDRHRSMRAVFDTSWQTITEDERTLLTRLSVFRGGLSRNAAQTVAGASLRTLSNLVTKSMLRRDPDQGSYHVHELLRQYAENRLNNSGDADDVRARHSAYYLASLRDIRPRLEGSAQIDALRDIDSDLENVRAAWLFGARHGQPALMRDAAPVLWQYAEMRGLYEVGQTLFEQAITLLRSHPASPERDAALGRVLAYGSVLATVLHAADAADAMLGEAAALLNEAEENERAPLLFARGFNHLTLKNPSDGRADLRAASEIWRDMGQRWAHARALSELSSTYWYRAEAHSSNVEQARTLAEEALAIQRALGDQFGMASTLLHLGTIASYAGDAASDAQCTAESLALFQRIGNRYGQAHALNNIGVREMMLGDYADSREHLEQSLRIKRDIGALIPIVWSQFVLARLAFNEGSFALSLQRCGEGLDRVRGTAHHEWELTLQLSRAQALTALGRYDEAVDACDRAEALANDIGNQEDAAFALNRKGQAVLLSGNAKRARAILHGANNQSSGAHDVTSVGAGLLLLASAELSLGDTAGARRELQPAFDYFTDRLQWQIGYTSDEWMMATWSVEAHLLDAEVSAAEGRIERGLRALQIAADAVDTTHSPAHRSKVVVTAAWLLVDRDPAFAARLAGTVVAGAPAYACDLQRANDVLIRCGPADDPFAAIDIAILALRQLPST
ncbi:MAG: protein kinase [Chloroflexi bacterium]|nr:protein kinase [Chloroflexota bacterium]